METVRGEKTQFNLELKKAWTEFIQCVDKEGLSERAKKLKKKYFELYRGYRKQEEWRREIKETSDPELDLRFKR